MSMKLIKKTDEFAIYMRGDERYAVKGADNKPVNGDDKVSILLAEGLITIAVPAAPAEAEVSEEPAAEEGDAAEAGDSAE
ncbi:MAG: hypothetical protein ACI87W_000769 [Halieaceae bacterium]|jgi:hypothetical protein